MQTMILSALAAAALSGPACAQNWELDQNTSSVRFEVTAFGNLISGAFEEFDAQIRFDPDDLANSSIEASVRTASVDGLSSDVRQNLIGDDGLNVSEYQRARFVSEEITKTEEGYEAVGDLTIKENTSQITLPFTLEISDGRAVADGRFTIDRTRFGVGSGWGEVADQVTVIVHAEADAAGAADEADTDEDAR